MSELKKCPFCEFQVSYPATSSDDNGYTTCPNCGGKAPHSVWQSRPIEDALQAKIDELKQENERLKIIASELGVNNE